MRCYMKLRDRIDLAQRIMRGQRLVNVVSETGYSTEMVKRFVNEIIFQTHWIGVHAGFKVDMRDVTSVELRRNKKHYQPIVNYFEQQCIAFQKKPTPDYPFLYLDLPKRAQAPILAFMSKRLGPEVLPTIQQVVDVFKENSVYYDMPKMGELSMLKLFEAIRENNLEFMWGDRHLPQVEKYIASAKIKLRHYNQQQKALHAKKNQVVFPTSLRRNLRVELHDADVCGDRSRSTQHP
jgi:uncharacterized HAD superfamily protein